MKVVSAALGLAESTVRDHVHGILVRLGCHSQLEAVAVARKRGLLQESRAAQEVVLGSDSKAQTGFERPR